MLICSMIVFVNSHGFLNDPPGRVPPNKRREAEFSGGLIYQYYYRGNFIFWFYRKYLLISAHFKINYIENLKRCFKTVKEF